jgi:hypothetical protein
MLASLPRGTEMLPPGPEMLPAPAGIENQDPIETDRPSSPSRWDRIYMGRSSDTEREEAGLLCNRTES